MNCHTIIAAAAAVAATVVSAQNNSPFSPGPFNSSSSTNQIRAPVSGDGYCGCNYDQFPGNYAIVGKDMDLISQTQETQFNDCKKKCDDNTSCLSFTVATANGCFLYRSRVDNAAQLRAESKSQSANLILASCSGTCIFPAMPDGYSPPTLTGNETCNADFAFKRPAFRFSTLSVVTISSTVLVVVPPTSVPTAGTLIVTAAATANATTSVTETVTYSTSALFTPVQDTFEGSFYVPDSFAQNMQVEALEPRQGQRRDDGTRYISAATCYTTTTATFTKTTTSALSNVAKSMATNSPAVAPESPESLMKQRRQTTTAPVYVSTTTVTTTSTATETVATVFAYEMCDDPRNFANRLNPGDKRIAGANPIYPVDYDYLTFADSAYGCCVVCALSPGGVCASWYYFNDNSGNQICFVYARHDRVCDGSEVFAYGVGTNSFTGLTVGNGNCGQIRIF